jgi:hypothetical protein
MVCVTQYVMTLVLSWSRMKTLSGCLLGFGQRGGVVGGIGDRHVEMDGGAVLRVESTDPRRDLRAPVAALRAVTPCA